MADKVEMGKGRSTIELIILGILQEKSMSAYEVVQYMEVRQIERLVKISKPSVYKICKRLYKEEYLTGKIVREGENPEKIIYSVNKKGQTLFLDLMQYFSGNIQPFFFDFNCFLWNIEKLEKKQALEMLLSLKAEFKQWAHWIIVHEKEVQNAPFSVRMIVKQYRMTIHTMLDWIKEVVIEFKRNKINQD